MSVEGSVNSVQHDQDPMLPVGIASTLGIAFFCAVTAVVTSAAGCGSTDGSFDIDDPQARPSSYCRLMHFPGFPDTIGSLLAATAVYLTPVLVVATGSIVAARMHKRSIFRISFASAIVLTLAVMAVSTLAHVGYAGAA